MQKNVQNNNNNKKFGPKTPYFSILGCKFEKLHSASSNMSKSKVS